MVLINTLDVLRRPALEPQPNIEPVEIPKTWYSVYGLNSQIDEILSRIQPGFYWQHYGDYNTFAEAVVNSRKLYAYRIIKCELFFDGNKFWGIKGTHL